MEILWLIIGFIIGLLVACFYLDARYKKQLAEREAELLQGNRRAEETLERERDAEIKRLESDLAECRAKAASTTSPVSSTAADMAGGTPPASAAASPASDEPDSAAADDLTKIKGVGQVLKGKLNQLGITTFKQIAEFTEADMERVNEVLDFPGRIQRERWVEQAKDLVRQ